MGLVMCCVTQWLFLILLLDFLVSFSNVWNAAPSEYHVNLLGHFGLHYCFLDDFPLLGYLLGFLMTLLVLGYFLAWIWTKQEKVEKLYLIIWFWRIAFHCKGYLYSWSIQFLRVWNLHRQVKIFHSKGLHKFLHNVSFFGRYLDFIPLFAAAVQNIALEKLPFRTNVRVGYNNCSYIYCQPYRKTLDCHLTFVITWKILDHDVMTLMEHPGAWRVLRVRNPNSI